MNDTKLDNDVRDTCIDILGNLMVDLHVHCGPNIVLVLLEKFSVLSIMLCINVICMNSKASCSHALYHFLCSWDLLHLLADILMLNEFMHVTLCQ